MRKDLLTRQMLAVATNRTRFLEELRSFPHGASVAQTASRLLKAIEDRPRLHVRWGPQSFTIMCSPSGAFPITLAIVEKRQARLQAGLGIVQGLMRDGIARATEETELAAEAYTFAEGLVPKTIPMVR